VYRRRARYCPLDRVVVGVRAHRGHIHLRLTSRHGQSKPHSFDSLDACFTDFPDRRCYISSDFFFVNFYIHSSVKLSWLCMIFLLAPLCWCCICCGLVCLSVRLSVTSRCSIKTAKGMIRQAMQHDSPGQ